MRPKRVLVTVGTTKFEELVRSVSKEDVLNVLVDLGYTEVQFQVGTGVYKVKKHPILKLNYNEFFEDFHNQITNADLVISHAGAGTCLEVLRSGKPLIVVINEDLMDNHQTELAEQLEKDEYLYFCKCGVLKETLHRNVKALKKYPKSNNQAFSNYLNKCMGFAQ